MKLSREKISDDEKNAYNIWVEHEDPEYHMLGKYVEAYKLNNFSVTKNICDIMKCYSDDVKAELLDLFDVKIDRLASKEKFVAAAYYKNMRTDFFKKTT